MLNSKETVKSIKFAVALWKETMDEGGLAWDDTNNNRAFLSRTISATNNGASIYIEAKTKPDTYRTEKDTPMAQDIGHAAIPKGAGGQFVYIGTADRPADGLFQEPEAGQGFPALDRIPSRCSTSGSPRSRATACGATKMWETHPVWDVDPVLKPFHDLPSKGRLAGWAGPPDRRSAEVVSKYIVVDMYAKAIQGMPAEDAAKWAHGEVAKVYV